MTHDADIELIVRIVVRVLEELGHGGGTAAPAARVTAAAPSGSPLRLATERDVLEAVPAGVLRLAQGAVVTPLAREVQHAGRLGGEHVALGRQAQRRAGRGGHGRRTRAAAGGGVAQLLQHSHHDPHDQLDVGIARHRIRATRRTWAKCRGDVMPSPVTVPIANPG